MIVPITTYPRSEQKQCDHVLQRVAELVQTDKDEADDAEFVEPSDGALDLRRLDKETREEILAEVPEETTQPTKGAQAVDNRAPRTLQMALQRGCHIPFAHLCSFILFYSQ